MFPREPSTPANLFDFDATMRETGSPSRTRDRWPSVLLPMGHVPRPMCQQPIRPTRHGLCAIGPCAITHGHNRGPARARPRLGEPPSIEECDPTARLVHAPRCRITTMPCAHPPDVHLRSQATLPTLLTRSSSNARPLSRAPGSRRRTAFSSICSNNLVPSASLLRWIAPSSHAPSGSSPTHSSAARHRPTQSSANSTLHRSHSSTPSPSTLPTQGPIPSAASSHRQRHRPQHSQDASHSRSALSAPRCPAPMPANAPPHCLSAFDFRA